MAPQRSRAPHELGAEQTNDRLRLLDPRAVVHADGVATRRAEDRRRRADATARARHEEYLAARAHLDGLVPRVPEAG